MDDQVCLLCDVLVGLRRARIQVDPSGRYVCVWLCQTHRRDFARAYAVLTSQEETKNVAAETDEEYAPMTGVAPGEPLAAVAATEDELDLLDGEFDTEVQDGSQTV